MSVSRRDILRMFPAAAASFLAGRNAVNRLSLAAAPQSVGREYGGSSLDGWELTLGDALYHPPEEPPVSLCDIELINHISCPERSYSELLANVNLRPIMAHAIAFYRLIDETALSFVHSCGYKFRLPYLPQADVNSEENGETIEGGIFVWDGGQTRLDYGMAFQWVVNPWAEDSGHLKAWTTGEQWVQVGELPLASEALKWHEVRMVVDYPSQDTQLFIDETQYQSYLAATPKTDWGTETAARLQAEVVSIYPQPSDIRAMHRAEFRDWYWSWTYKAYLPLVLKAPATLEPTPDTCASAYFTHPVTDQTISNPFDVCWVPDTCIMVLQAYQNGGLIYENKEAASCTTIDIPSGLTELKIWVPGSHAPADTLWVTIV
jgi:hypothetical protein